MEPSKHQLYPVAWAVYSGVMRALSGRFYERKFSWAHMDVQEHIAVFTLTFLLLLFPLCLRISGRTVEYLRKQVFIAQRTAS